MEFGCTQLINYLSRNIDTIVIGRRFGTESLGSITALTSC
ncbi:hypothetical protein GS432_01330 [Rhodococcus hoagii]|nr:hypothetical protein [Prescottella equi]